MTKPRQLALATAVAAGAVQVVAHAWLGWTWLAWLAPALLATAVTVSDIRPARLGFLSGLVFAVPLLHWIRFRATVVAWLLLALVVAAWMALLAWGLYHLLQRRWTILLAPVWWVGIEAWRNAWPWSGFGWATLGITQVGNSWLTPLGRVVGEKGYTFVVVALSLALWVAVRDGLAARRHDGDDVGATATQTNGRDSPWPGDSRVTAGATPGMLALVATMLGVTLVTVGPPGTDDTIDVVAVQPNDITDPSTDYTTVTHRLAEQSVALTSRALDAGGPADMVVWPEGAIGRDPGRDPVLAAALEEAGARTGGRLLVGTDLEDPDSTGFHRVSIVVGEDGTTTDTYVKQDLVPFGEYVPLRSVLDWYPALQQVSRDAIPGRAPDNVVMTGRDDRSIVVAVGICFETMYPQTLVDNMFAHDRVADLVVTSTSSASFGNSDQPFQHLAQARMRAIETGRWVVHATSSGVTAMVDQHGRVRTDPTDLFEQDWVRAEVGLATGLTPFVRLGDVLDPVTRVAAGVILLGLLVAGRRARSERHVGARGPSTAGNDQSSSATSTSQARQ